MATYFSLHGTAWLLQFLRAFHHFSLYALLWTHACFRREPARSSARGRLGSNRTGILSKSSHMYVWCTRLLHLTSNILLFCSPFFLVHHFIISVVKTTGSGYGYLAPPPNRNMGRSSSAQDLPHMLSKASPRHMPRQHSGSQQNVVGGYGSLRKCRQHASLSNLHCWHCSMLPALGMHELLKWLLPSWHEFESMFKEDPCLRSVHIRHLIYWVLDWLLLTLLP